MKHPGGRKPGDQQTPKQARAAARQRAYRARQTPEQRAFDQRRHRLWREYRITVNDFDKMLDEQDGACAICRTQEPDGRGWHVDHDHDTGVVRGILCHSCNTGIGSLGDDPDRLDAAAEYLRLHSQAL